jgi:hypothetical protein
MTTFGAISRFERFDQTVLQNLLIKNKNKLDEIDPYGERFLEDDDQEVPFIIDDKSSFDIPKARPQKRRESIMVQKGIPRNFSKVHFSMPIEEAKQDSKEKFLSPHLTHRNMRRSTITHDKMDPGYLMKYSMIAAGKVDKLNNLEAKEDNSIDFCASRRKSVMAAKKIRNANERIGLSMKKLKQNRTSSAMIPSSFVSPQITTG